MLTEFGNVIGAQVELLAGKHPIRVRVEQLKSTSVIDRVSAPARLAGD
jgi:hypothetical protein